ncbi:hypothetical protein BKA64DRAFT_467995 [Cadophora sp. MPI-SDFR-AT-0126]|nr:hypothetical protein BKA64DRAFT_467995 [Leotiomycetes sp. MPI-SDFR-AT-0126]
MERLRTPDLPSSELRSRLEATADPRDQLTGCESEFLDGPPSDRDSDDECIEPRNIFFRSLDSGYESFSARESLEDDPKLDQLRPALDFAGVEYASTISSDSKAGQAIRCYLCDKLSMLSSKSWARLRNDGGVRPYTCTACRKPLSYPSQRMRHGIVHSLARKFVCKGDTKQGESWGCGRIYAQVDALGRHFLSEAGRVCIKPLMTGEAAALQHYSAVDKSEGGEHDTATPNEFVGNVTFPAALLVQYPQLVSFSWSDAGYNADLSGSSLGTRSMYGDEPDKMLLQPRTAEYLPGQNFVQSLPLPTVGDMNMALAGIGDRYLESETPNTRTVFGASTSSQHCVPEESCPTQGLHVSVASFAGPIENEVLNMSKLAGNSKASAIRRIDKSAENYFDVASDPRPAGSTKCAETTPWTEPPENGEDPSQVLSGGSDCEDSENSEAETVSSDFSASQSSFLAPVIEGCERDMIEGLMAEFKTLLDHSLGVRSRTSGTDSSNSPPPRSCSGLPSGQASSGSGKRKERHEDDSGSSNEGGDDDGSGGSKRTRMDGPSLDVSPRKFACPYFRQNPIKHTKFRSCAGPGFDSIHRVKEHVLRQHRIPVHCHRCYEVFKTEMNLVAHQRLPSPCEVKTPKLLEGCTKEQERLLRKRNRGLRSDEDKWREIFKCLFPDYNDDMIPTPFYDGEEIAAWESRRDTEFSQYEEFLARELPLVVRQQLEDAFRAAARPLENELRSQLVDIVRDAQSTLFRSFRQTTVSRGVVANSVPDGVEIDQAQTDFVDDQELPPIFDFSAFFTPPPIAPNSFGGTIGVDFPASFPTDPADICQPVSDSGYGSNNTGFNVSRDRIEPYGFDGTEELLKFSNGGNIPPSASQGSFQNSDGWLQ